GRRDPGSLPRPSVGSDAGHPAIGLDDQRRFAGSRVADPRGVGELGGAEPGDLPPHRQLNRVADPERRPRGRHREVLVPADEDITARKTDEDDERGGPPPEKRGQEPQARPPEPAIPAKWGMTSETSSSRVSGSPSRSLWISRSTPASWYCPIR